MWSLNINIPLSYNLFFLLATKEESEKVAKPEKKVQAKEQKKSKVSAAVVTPKKEVPVTVSETKIAKDIKETKVAEDIKAKPKPKEAEKTKVETKGELSDQYQFCRYVVDMYAHGDLYTAGRLPVTPAITPGKAAPPSLPFKKAKEEPKKKLPEKKEVPVVKKTAAVEEKEKASMEKKDVAKIKKADKLEVAAPKPDKIKEKKEEKKEEKKKVTEPKTIKRKKLEIPKEHPKVVTKKKEEKPEEKKPAPIKEEYVESDGYAKVSGAREESQMSRVGNGKQQVLDIPVYKLEARWD
ncbi:uncharacterized protein ACMZJ9_007643 [Mantella aurantiaca]